MPVFSSTYSPLFLIIFLIISAAVSIYFYRNSAISRSKKYLLASIKTAALFLLLALFIEPVLSQIFGDDSTRLDVILIDNSRSSNLGNNEEEIRSIITNSGIGMINDNYRTFTFGDKLKLLQGTDSLDFSGYETDLSSALKHLKRTFPDRDFNSITVISDGIFNTGGNPLYEARTFQAPFITFPIGDTIQKNDIVLKDVLFNNKAFTNSPVKIRSFINIHGYPAGLYDIKLKREGTVISSKVLNTTAGQFSYEAEFDVTETTPGKILYEVEAAHVDGELTYKNNAQKFFITYSDNKVNLLVVSGGPGYDNEFTGSILKRLGNYNITYRTAKSPTEFYEGGIDAKEFPELSVIFLLNYPTSQTAASVSSDIAMNVKTHKVPVIFFAGKNTDYQKLNSFDELIPFNISRPGSGEALFNLQPVGSQDNPLSKINGLGSTSQIFRNVSGILPKPGSVTLATDKSSGEPVMITRTSGDIKSTALLAYGLWKWKLNPSSDGSKVMESLLQESINMTLQKEKKTRFRVYPEKDVFDYLENIIILAEVFDENYNPTRNAIVNGRLYENSGSKIAELKFNPDENKYISIYAPLLSNEYKVEADAEVGGSFYAKDESRFVVDSINTEYLETASNYHELKELSLNTGGVFIDKENAGSLLSVIDSTENPFRNERVVERFLRFNLWENRYMLGLILLLFTIEWVLRKRNNIP
jgi:hypothetical protein